MQTNKYWTDKIVRLNKKNITALIDSYNAKVEVVPNQTGCGLYWTRIRVISWISKQPEFDNTNIDGIYKVVNYCIFIDGVSQ